MKIEDRILNEIKRYHRINSYLLEQDTGIPQDAPEGDLPPELATEPAVDAAAMPPDAANAPTTPATDVSPIPPTTEEIPANIEATPIGGEPEMSSSEGTEELDITDLVLSQQDILGNQEKFFDKLFGQIDRLGDKLSEIDKIMDRIDKLDTKIEKYREPTAQEKLELRTLDSYPFTQKLSSFFDDKQTDLAKSKKNEYVLTSDEVKDINPNQIKDTFATFDEDEYFKA